MKYDIFGLNTNYYNDETVIIELNKHVNTLKNARIVAMNLLPNGWTSFLIEYQP